MLKKSSPRLQNSQGRVKNQAFFALATGLVRFFPLAEGFRPGINTPTELKDGFRLRLRFGAVACALASNSISSLTKYSR